MDGPGLHYVRRSYRKQAALVAQGNLKMLTRHSPEAVQVQSLPKDSPHGPRLFVVLPV